MSLQKENELQKQQQNMEPAVEDSKALLDDPDRALRNLRCQAL